MIFQRTLKSEITLEGIGLHSGKPSRLILRPALPNTGILFIRRDLPFAPTISANFQKIMSTQLATTLGHGRVSIGTVEHIMAALQGCEIDNAILEVDGPEVPIMDGSASAFVDAIEQVGAQGQLRSRPIMAIRKRVEVKLEEKWAVAEPASGLELHASIDWDHPLIGYQEFRYLHGKTPFRDISSARTFGFLKDVEALKRAGLARGGSLDNAVVLDETSVLNPGGLRSHDEFVRHKVLDALGDFKLAGVAIHGYFRLHRAGHELHNLLLSEIFRNPSSYEMISGSETRTQERLRPAVVRKLATV